MSVALGPRLVCVDTSMVRMGSQCCAASEPQNQQVQGGGCNCLKGRVPLFRCVHHRAHQVWMFSQMWMFRFSRSPSKADQMWMFSHWAHIATCATRCGGEQLAMQQLVNSLLCRPIFGGKRKQRSVLATVKAAAAENCCYGNK